MTIILAGADAHFRGRLKKRLEKIDGVHVIGESSDSEETTAMILNRKPDIAILSCSLRDGHSIEVLEHVKRFMALPTAILITDDSLQDELFASRFAGVSFIFEKVVDDDNLVNAVRHLCAAPPGSKHLTPPLPCSMTDKLFSGSRSSLLGARHR